MQRLVRKAHRYLGLIVGIQFLAWTAGGLYFSWTDIEQVRGDNIRAEKPPLPFPAGSSGSLTPLLDSLRNKTPHFHLKSIQVVSVLDTAYYQIQFGEPTQKVMLFEVKSLRLKTPLSQQEAIEVARKSLKNPSEISRVEYLTSANGHHEYREKPLPAYAITFGKPNYTTVYVAIETGTVQSFRNNVWRVYDFLWMLHTMDYAERDNFNNWLIRIFSLFGVVTIFSGFTLYGLTLKFTKK